MMKNLKDLSPVYFTFTVMLGFFLILYPRKGNSDYPNYSINEWCRQLSYQVLNNTHNIPSVHPVNGIYRAKNPPKKPKHQKTPKSTNQKTTPNLVANQGKDLLVRLQISFFCPNWTKMTVY